MAGRVAGKVAFVTGAARGQGRSHAVRLAEEGADIIAVDICAPVRGVQYAGSTPEDLAETVRPGGEARSPYPGRRDRHSRRRPRSSSSWTRASAELGRLDIIVANAGICIAEPWHKVTAQTWQDTIDINLTGSWNTIKAGIDHLVSAKAGSIIVTSSTAGLKGNPYLLSYVVSKHGVTGMVRALAHELGQHNIRVNAVNPATVDTSHGRARLQSAPERGDCGEPGRRPGSSTRACRSPRPSPSISATRCCTWRRMSLGT